MFDFKTFLADHWSDPAALHAFLEKWGVKAAPVAVSSGAFNTLTVSAGIITLTPNAYKGIAGGDTCVMTPSADANNRLQWLYSGNCVTNGFVKN